MSIIFAMTPRSTLKKFSFIKFYIKLEKKYSTSCSTLTTSLDRTSKLLLPTMIIKSILIQMKKIMKIVMIQIKIKTTKMTLL